MSSALAKASPLKPDIRLAQAISEFEADLSPEQKSKFRTLSSQSRSTTPSPHDVMQLTAEVDRYTSKFGSACFGPRFINFLHGVQQFATVGDVLVGGSQHLLACGVWSLVRMSLLSIVNLSAYVEKLSSLFMDIGRSAPRYQEIALLYPQSSKLQSHLFEYFTVVVGLCHYLFKFGKKSAIQKFASSLSDARLKAFQTDLHKWAASIKEQMDVSEAQENSGFRGLTRQMFKSASYEQRLRVNARVLDFCSTYDHEVAWKQIRKAGNMSFYRQQAEYQEWRDGSYSSTLLYTGKLGSGKSVLLANIVDDLSLSAKDPSLVAYFFCKHDIPKSLQARTIIGSLARQLLRTVPDLSVLAKSCENTHTIGDTEKVLETLLQGFSAHTKVYFVLDGLDECNDEEKETLVQAIGKIQVKLKMLVCASFREEPNNGLQSITGSNQLLAIRAVSIPDDNPDIDAFIEADLERCLHQKRLTIGDPTLFGEIQDRLSKGSQGMFLWVALQIRTLCSMKTDHAIREALADLPKDLSETFARILRKSANSEMSGSSDLALQRKTLQFVLAAYQPLTTNELREALSVTPGDTTWDPSKMLNDVYSALACCGCLLSVDEEELTVRVIHHSVKQYILNTNFSFQEAQRMFSDTVVTYLGYGVFGTELSRVKTHPIVAQSAPSKIVQATISSSSTARHMAIKFLESRRQHEFDMSKALAGAHSSFNSKPEHAFRFYAYAKIYWQDHVFYASGHNAAIFKLCSKLIYSRASELNKMDKDYWTHFQWAAENGNRNILELLLQAGKANIEVKNSNGWTPLMQAARGGHRDTVEVLLTAGKADVEARDRDAWTPLMEATRGGHRDTVEVLLTVGKADAEAKNGVTTAMMIAIAYGYIDIVELLFTVGKVDIEAKDDLGYTAVMRAVASRHRNVVELLLTVGKADVNAKNKRGLTALMVAAINGQRDLVEALLTVGKADVNAKDKKGSTALALAERHGHRDIVEVLHSYTKRKSKA
ncbi:NACHT domain protein [Bipolaris maydis]|nr:NACHT domain protein [Bipolaris maydis]